MRQWRARCRRDINYTGQIYEVAQLEWTQTSYVEPQIHPFDRLFYDRDSHKYTVTRFLDDLTIRYGGVDSMLIWPTYPMIGAWCRSACLPPIDVLPDCDGPLHDQARAECRGR
jgi:iron(II)-dependent oxidoreductase